ncbi:MAG: NAD(P)/FAD-dependent oxidoreductase [Pseudooceanicola sp.]
MKRHVIIGAGPAGHRAALTLADRAPDDEIVLVGAESGLPYDRTQVSKDLIAPGAADPAPLRGASDYGTAGIVYRPATRAAAMSPAERTVTLDDGTRLGWDRLLLATGSRPRRFRAEGVACHVLRRAGDSREFASRLLKGAHLVVIGGGFIGLEAAAMAVSAGCHVTILEREVALMTRVLPPRIGEVFAALHGAHGVTIRCGEAVRALQPAGDRVRVETARREILCDVVLCATGIVPDCALAQAAGLRVDNGIVVDRQCRTSAEGVFAAGEVTCHPSGPDGTPRRIESWRVAGDQAAVAAANMAGDDESYEDMPWMWTDQYDANLQVLGSFTGAGRLLLKGTFEDRSWSLLETDQQGQPVAVAAFNAGREISMMRRLLRKGSGSLPGRDDGYVRFDGAHATSLPR